ncbi:alpha/beta-hydrolase [Hypoxylon sp. FL0543]|nr:alpha/beta-hydrolase [Hypoxylon sp. FL0543]
MRRMAPLPLLMAVLSFIVADQVSANPFVKLEHSEVTYRGVRRNYAEHFMNIKYAHDTSGSRRFAPPEPYIPPIGIEVEAKAPGPACPQSKEALPPFFDETVEISEDCLNLRISRPAGTNANDELPVVVWLHGGGVIKGSAYDSHFDPENLLELSTALKKPVIYVALNYRLTIFGFAQLPILKNQKSMNVGLRDQRVGLEWIKNNIRAFGGDPDRVTLFGQSAGGTFASMHLLAYGGKEGVPFTQVWAISGPPGTALNVTSDVVELHTRTVAENVQCRADKDEDILKCLRTVPVEKLTEAAMEHSRNNHPPYGALTFFPSVDGDFIPDRHTVLYKSGNFVKGIPIVFGWTHDDASVNAAPATEFHKEEDMKRAIKPWAHAFTDDDYEEIFSRYPASDFEEELRSYEAHKKESDPDVPIHFYRVSRILRDIFFTCSSINFGYEVSRQSKAIDPAFPGVRVYDLNQSMLTSMLAASGMPYLGTCHGSDINYIFNGVFPEGQVQGSDKQLSESMAGSFINFAYTGNPTYAGDAHFNSWPEAFPEAEGLNMHVDEHLPSSMNLQLIGGPLGTGHSLLRMKDEDADCAASLGTMQEPLGEGVEFGEMESQLSQKRQRVLEHEKLLERCAFIDSLSEKLGV